MSRVRLGLVGNPNCGKTTLFNALTGHRQRVGNWPGVTVERKSGTFTVEDTEFEITDLPGIYSVSACDDQCSLDQRIACEYILDGQCDILINIIDANNLERNLYLTTQLLDMQVPMVVAVNMLDVAAHRELFLDLAVLAQQLQCPAVGLQAHKQQGLADLKSALMHVQKQPKSRLTRFYAPEFVSAIAALQQEIDIQLPHYTHCSQSLAIRLLEHSAILTDADTQTIQAELDKQQKIISTNFNDDCDIVLASLRYEFCHEVSEQVYQAPKSDKKTITDFLDNIALSRIYGIPLFLGVMYLMFIFAMNVGGAFQDFFDQSTEALFVHGTAQLLHYFNAPETLTTILAAGMGKGVNTTLTFIPVIGALFLFLSFLEGSGYMARAAFVMDKLLCALGLPGKAFVPMIVGFGCNVPAIMATRTLQAKRDRIIAVMMSPFMSCGARLAIYAAFTAAFFPLGGAYIVFALYIIGILMAIVTGLLLNKTLLAGTPSPMMIELPPYHLPNFRTLSIYTWYRLKSFIFKAGKVIIPLCMILGTLNSIQLNTTPPDAPETALAYVGKHITPIFKPMGITQDNWPATVGLLSGTLAKETVIATLNTLYTQKAGLHTQKQDAFNLKSELIAAVKTIPHNLIAGPPIDTLDQTVYGVMYKHFDGRIGAFAYLLFVLLYFPCISATAAMMRELNTRWALFSVTWTTGVAYIVAVLFYQIATFMRHPLLSIDWIIAAIISILLTSLVLRRYQQKALTL